ncbi:hypothetical protein GGI43DRAFT_406331 [Trichoderma evansii]
MGFVFRYVGCWLMAFGSIGMSKQVEMPASQVDDKTHRQFSAAKHSVRLPNPPNDTVLSTSTKVRCDFLGNGKEAGPCFTEKWTGCRYWRLNATLCANQSIGDDALFCFQGLQKGDFLQARYP